MPTETEEKTSLRESIEKAADDQRAVPEKEEEIVEKDEKSDKQTPEDRTKDSDKESSETKGSEVKDEEIETALELYRALRNPEQQMAIIKDLALQAGLLKEGEKPTKAESKAISEVVTEVLGEEYPDLKPKFEQILNKLTSDYDKQISDLRKEVRDARMQDAQKEFVREFDTFIESNKIDDDIAAQMLKEIELMPPNPNGKAKLSLTQYLTKIHRLAAGDKREVESAIKRNKRIQENLEERSSNLSSDVDESRIKTGSHRPSIRESVEAAAKGIIFDK